MVVPKCFKDDNATQWKVKNSTIATPKIPETIVTKVCMGDCRDRYPMQNFITIRLPPFALPNMRKCTSVDSAGLFLEGSRFFRQPTNRNPAPILTMNTSNDIVSHILARKRNVRKASNSKANVHVMFAKMSTRC